jgi:hypothetical protein
MLTLFEISNSLIFKNQLEFIKINDTKPLNSRPENVYFVILQLQYEILNDKLFNEHVFANTKVLSVAGMLYTIEEKLFRDFNRIRVLFISIENLQSFFHSGTKWMNGLNYDLNVDLKNVIPFNQLENRELTLQLDHSISHFSHEYKYPDEDMCLFRDFPHEKLIFPLIIFTSKFDCTCTILWLIKYYNLYYKEDFSDFRFESIGYIGTPNYPNLSAQICFGSKLCEFDGMFNKCEKVTIEKQKSSPIFGGYMTNYYTLKWTQYIIEVFFKSTFCLLGIITNLMNILVIKNEKKNKNFKPVMYKHLLINSIFNILFCLIHILSLMNICIFSRTSFCSSIYKYESVQYFKIFGVYFFGSSIRLSANISYILLCLTRFFLSTSSNEPNKYFKKINTMNLKYFYSFVVIFGCSLSSFKIYEYSATDFYSFITVYFPFDKYGINVCDKSINKSKSFELRCDLFPVLNWISNFINNVLFLILNVIIDIFLIRFSNEMLERKRKVITDKKHLEEAIKYKEKVNKMAVTNGSIFLLSHMPEFIVTLLVVILKKNLSFFCYYYFTCTELIDIAESFSVISMSLCFFVYMKFDRNFKESFFDYVERIYKKSLTSTNTS